MRYDMCRWVKPKNEKEMAIALKIDDYFKCRYPGKIVGDGDNYRLVVDIPKSDIDKTSPGYLLKLATIFSANDTDECFRQIVNKDYVQTAQNTCRKTINDVLGAISADVETAADEAFATNYINDIILVQIPYQYASDEKLMCKLTVSDFSDLDLDCIESSSADPRTMYPENRLCGEIILDNCSGCHGPTVTIYANIRLQDIIALKQSTTETDDTMTIFAGSLVLDGSKRLLNRDISIPFASINRFSIGWLDDPV